MGKGIAIQVPKVLMLGELPDDLYPKGLGKHKVRHSKWVRCVLWAQWQLCRPAVFSQSSVATSAWERIRKLQDVGVISSCQEKVGKGKARADLTQPLTPFSVSQVKGRCVWAWVSPEFSICICPGATIPDSRLTLIVLSYLLLTSSGFWNFSEQELNFGKLKGSTIHS